MKMNSHVQYEIQPKRDTFGRFYTDAPMQKSSATLISFIKKKLFNIHMQQETLSSIQLKNFVLNGKSTSFQERLASSACLLGTHIHCLFVRTDGRTVRPIHSAYDGQTLRLLSSMDVF